MQKCVDLFKALSDETRLKIMILLSEKELCVCQIEHALNLAQAKVSRHLMVLRHAGLVHVRRDGLWMHYSLVNPRNALEAKLFSCFRKFLRTQVYFDKDLVSVKKCDAGSLRNFKKISRKR